MYIAPNSSIIILKGVPFDNTYDHTIYFDVDEPQSVSVQTNYFKAYKKYTLEMQSYQRVNKGIINVYKCADDLYDCNYLMFQNTSFGSKWFYAFIKSVEYISNNVSAVEYEIDVMQTWFFDYKVNPCFVEREHTMNDEIGSNTVPEKVELGEYVSDDFSGTIGENADGVVENLMEQLMIVVAATFKQNNDGSYEDYGGGIYSGMFSGLYYTAFPLTPEGANNASNFINNAKNKADGIVSVFIMPLRMMTYPSVTVEGVSVGGEALRYNLKYTKKTTSIGDFTPNNNKLFTYPYNFMYVTNLQGNGVAFPYEFFDDDTYCTFGITSDFTPNPSVMLYPTNYKGVTDNYDEKIILSGFPQCAYNTDSYKAWLAQNSVSLGVSTATSLAGGALGIISASAMTNPVTGSLALAGGVISLISGVGNAVASVYEHSIVPNQARGSSGSSVLVSAGVHDFGYMHKHIRVEYARIIDEYFDVYGYATNRVKIPNRGGRQYWNYVKTIGANLRGSIPVDDMNKIKSIYDKGITFWNLGATVGDYTQDNRLRGENNG